MAYAKAGPHSEAQLITAQHRELLWVQALLYAGLGEKDKAIEGLRTMEAIKHPRSRVYPAFPEFASLRGDPRLNEIRKTLGLPKLQ